MLFVGVRKKKIMGGMVLMNDDAKVRIFESLEKCRALLLHADGRKKNLQAAEYLFAVLCDYFWLVRLSSLHVRKFVLTCTNERPYT